MFSKSALIIRVLLFTLAVPLCVAASELTSGAVYRFDDFQSRISLHRPGLSYSAIFYGSAWDSTPCRPCFPGDVVNTSNHIFLNARDFIIGDVTIGSQKYYNWEYFFPDPPFPYAKLRSWISFYGGSAEVPISDAPDLILVTPFTMGATVEGFNSSARLFGAYISGSGFVWLHVRRTVWEGTPAYSFSSMTYQIATGIDIDVKPGDELNYINLKSHGKTPIAILSTATFDAGTVDPFTITVAGAPVSLRSNGTTASSLEDVNGDGLLDLVVHVSTRALQPTSPNQVLLEAYTVLGERLWGSDEMILE